MKLHLPKVLFAAVVAAVCCAHVAYADTTTEKKSYTVGEGDTAVTYDVTAFTGATNTSIDPTDTALLEGTTMLGFEMTDVTSDQKYFKDGDFTYAGDIYISKGVADTDTKTGMVITNGYGGKTYTFGGAVYGDGDIYKTGAPSSGVTLKFTGDMSAYTGATEITGAYTTSKLIYDGATTGTGTIQSNGAISMNNTTINNSAITTIGTLSITGTTSIASALTLTATKLEISKALDVSAEGASITFGADTTLNVKVSDLLAGNYTGTVKYDHKNIDAAGSGYLRVENLELFTDYTKVSGANITLDISGSTTTLSPNVKVTATFTGAYGVASDATYTAAVMGSAKTLILDNSATLTLTETPTAVTNGIIVKGADTKLNLSGKETEMSQSAINVMSGGMLKIKGDGTYKVSSQAIATGVALDSTWTGTVEYSGQGSFNALTNNLAQLGNENSTIVLKNVTGHIGTTSGGLSGKTLELVDDGDTKALTIVNGSSKNNEAEAITGANSYLAAKLKGSGSIVHKATEVSGTHTAFTFEGDVSKWEGAFSLEAKTLALRFGGDASLVKASIGKTDGTLNLKIGNTGKKTTFTNTVAVDSISVDADNTMSLGGATTTTDLTLGEGAALDFSGGTLSVTNSITLSTVTVSDLSKYFNADDLSVDLVMVTGAEQSISGWAGAVSTGTYTVDGTSYTSTVDQSDNSIVLTFAKLDDAESLLVDSATLTGNVLTLNVDANLTDVTAVDLMLSEAALAEIAGKGGLVSLSLVAADGTFTTVETDGATLISNVTFYNGAYAGEGNGMYQIAYIPEPTTATLSLLALAGLAARRRRK